MAVKFILRRLAQPEVTLGKWHGPVKVIDTAGTTDVKM